MPGFKYIKKKWKNGKWHYTYPDDAKKKTASNDSSKSSSLLDKVKFKYIKREWKNGKWVYTYPDDLKKPGLLDKVKDALGFDEKERAEAAKNRADAARSEYSTQVATSGSNTRIALDKARAAGAAYVNAREEFMKTPLGKLQALKDRGNFAIKNLFKNSSNTKMNEVERANHSIDVTIDRVRRETDGTRNQNGMTSDFLSNLRKLRANNPFPSLPIKKTPSSEAQDEARINPNYDQNNPNTSMNCFYCTVAYDLRRKGYDVKAIEESSRYGIKQAMRMYKDAQSSHVTVETFMTPDGLKSDVARSRLNNQLLSYGNGAHGNLCMYWKMGGGHSIAWEVKNNKVILRDTQLNTVDELMEWGDFGLAYDFYTFRTDNWTPPKKVLKLVNAA